MSNISLQIQNVKLNETNKNINNADFSIKPIIC